MEAVKSRKEHRTPSKCREWEKVRRDKLNKSFQTLSKLLPSHDPSLNLSKIDILEKATEYIEELQTKLKDVLTSDGVKKTECEEIKALYKRIRKLLLRNEQLFNLLKDAGIRIPSEYGTIKNFKEPLRWCNKITPEQAKQFAKEEAQKENKKEPKVTKKPKLKHGIKKAVISPAKLRKKDSKKSNKKLSFKKPAIISVQFSNVMPIARPNVPIVTTQSCFIITNNPPIGLHSPLNRIRKTAPTVVTNSSSLAAPKMASIIKPPTSTVIPKVNATLSSLGPGTLILANGNIVPILPQQTILTNPTPLLLKPPSNNTTLIVMPTKNKEIFPTTTTNTTATTSGTKSTVSTITSCATTKIFANIKPKKFCITRTTQINKVPISALTSRYSDLPLSSKKLDQNVKKPETEKSNMKKVNKVKRKVTNLDLSNKRLKTDKQSENPVKSNAPDVVKKSSENNTDVTNAEVQQPTASSKSDPKVPLEAESSKVSDALTSEIVNKENVDVKTQNDAPKNKTEAKESSDEIKTSEKTDNVSAVEKAGVDVAKVVKPAVEIAPDTPASQPDKPANKDNSDDKEHNNKLPTEEKTPVSDDNKAKATTSMATKTTPLVVQTEANSEIQVKNLELGMNLNHSELSNDIFSSLQVPIGGQNPESTSPTAAFLLAFPLVSSLTGVKVTEVIEEENSDSRHGTPTLLQIGTMDSTKTTQSVPSESLTPNLLNLDNFSFFSGKDMCGNFYSSFDNSACGSSNVYPVNSAQANSAKNSTSCKANEVLSTAKSKVCETPKLQPKETSGGQVSQANVYTTEVTPKSTPNNFIRQSAVSYSKVAPVSSSYVQQYDARHKNMSTATAPTCKDVSLVRKTSDPVLTTSQYNTSTSNPVSVAQCNAFNPFSDFSKPNTVHSYSTFSKPYSDPLYTNSTHYNYSHHNENNFEQGMYYPTKSSKPSTSSYNTPNYPDPSYNADCKNKRESNQRHNPVNYYNQTKPHKEKFSTHSSKTPKTQPKPPINWMTTPDFRSQPANTEYLVPPFGKDIEYNPNSFYSSNSFVSTTHTSYFNATSSMYTAEFQDNRKAFDSGLPIISTNSTQRNEYEENQFSWSPTKLPQFLETSHSFVSSTLPTLVGDLALGTTQPQFGEHKVDQTNIKPKESNRRSKTHSVNYDNQSNFLSVSQLVENKSDPSSARATNRRNSGNRSVKNASQKSSKHSHKPESKELVEGAAQTLVMEKSLKPTQAPNINYSMQGVSENSSWMADCNKPNRHSHKNPQSSYSAEALIGHQDQDSSVPKQRYRQQQTNYAPNKALPIPTFLSDNIVPYFPPVEIPQDNNFIQTNPNYQSSALSHTFATSQNNVYPSGTYISTGATITSSYLQSSGLIPEFGAHDYTAPISDNVIPHSTVDKTIDKHCRNEPIKQPNRTEERPNVQQINTDCSGSTNPSNNFMKKSKHKHSNETNLPGLVDFGFLPMPSSINSPILPDDFHAHSNFLPPPTPSQLYPCKNPLYSKQSSDLNSGSLLSLTPVPVTRTGTQHFETATASNAGSSLTSFNLSAIFPEINKGPMPLPGLYPSESSRNKNYNYQRNYIGGSVQVSFSNKSTSSSSYVNSVATTYAPTN